MEKTTERIIELMEQGMNAKDIMRTLRSEGHKTITHRPFTNQIQIFSFLKRQGLEARCEKTSKWVFTELSK